MATYRGHLYIDDDRKPITIYIVDRGRTYYTHMILNGEFIMIEMIDNRYIYMFDEFYELEIKDNQIVGRKEDDLLGFLCCLPVKQKYFIINRV